MRLVRLLASTVLAVSSLSIGLGAIAGCGGGTKEVEMKGKDPDLAALAGEWEGSYKGNESGREGPITFSLQMGRHTAEGTVLMGGDTPIRIEFVSVEGGQISGKIDPYMDPNCSCEVETEFLGTLDGDTIAGMFTTKVTAQGVVQTGTWSVSRK
jgi:hypothetical protein